MAEGKQAAPLEAEASTQDRLEGPRPAGCFARLTGPSFPCAASLAAVAPALLVLVLAVYFIFYSYPQADDYTRAGEVRRMGVLNALRYDYLHWTGRWVAVAVSAAAERSGHFAAKYPFLLLGIFALLGVSAHLFLSTVLELPARGARAFVLTVCFLGLYWSGAPAPGETFYWLCAAVEYHCAVALGLLVLTMLIRSSRGGRRPVATGACLASLALIATGCHELTALALCAILGVGTARAFRARASGRWVWGAVTLAAIAGFLVVALAPGNQIRSDYFPQRGSLPLTLRTAATWAAEVLPWWLIDPKLWGATLLAIVLLRAGILRPAWAAAGGAAWRLAIPLGCLTLLALMFAAPPWAMGLKGPDRLLDEAYFLFLLGWFLTLVAWFAAPSRIPPIRRALTVPMTLIGLVLWGGGLLCANNTRIAVSDVGPTTAVWRREMVARGQQIRSAVSRGERDVRVSKLSARPGIYPFLELTLDPANFINLAVAHYYGARSIVLVEANQPAADSQ